MLRQTLIVVLFVGATLQAAPLAAKPVLEPVWKKSTVGYDAVDDPVFHDEYAKSKAWLLKNVYEPVTVFRHAAGKWIIPPATPSVDDESVIVRDDRGIVRYALKPMQIGDQAIKRGEVATMLDFEYALAAFYRSSEARLRHWITQISTELLSELIIHRTLSATITRTSSEVFSIDELACVANRSFGGNQGNIFRTMDTESGKMWLGVPYIRLDEQLDATEPFYFYSSPFPLQDECIFLFELNKSVRMARFQWRAHSKHHREPYKKSVRWETELFVAPKPAVQDLRRRIHAAHLTTTKDLVIAPTNQGHVVALNVNSGKQVWFYEYAAITDGRFPTFAPEWVVVPPTVVGDKYIIAPADFPELLCLDTAKGRKVWSVKKVDGLYPAVIGEQVLVIGEKSLRSHKVADGSEQWKLDLPGLPCGRGAMLGDNYLLPFSEPKTWRGMIAVVDVKAGKILEVIKPAKDEPIGNLVVHKEFLVSQTLTEIAVFPIRK